jgi:uncharacterized Zn finger protein (UPF0148 family)
MATSSVSCGACGVALAEEPGKTPASCPACGSTRRHYSVALFEKVEVHERLATKVKDPRRPGKSKIRVESVSGDDLYRKTGEWNKLERSIDRANNRYREKIVDPRTGAVLSTVDEPLDQHQGHGSAKRKS